MSLELLEVGLETDQLSACRLALILGVFTNENRIETFLRIVRRILNADTAILDFINEPYIWHYSEQGFKAFYANKQADFSTYFKKNEIVEESNPVYPEFSDYVISLGVRHRRIIGIDLKYENVSLGHVFLFDDQEKGFAPDAVTSVVELSRALGDYLKLSLENVQLKELYDEQITENYSKTKFFQIIAHDLRAPFHGLLGFSEVLAEERDTLQDQDVQEIADYLLDTANSTYGLLENLLNWAMAEGGRFVYHPINFELKQATNIVTNVLNGLVLKKNIQLIEDIPPQTKVHADINMITSVIQNLVSNALKFTHSDGTGVVKISAETIENKVHIYVQDSGMGMSPSHMEHIFDSNILVSLKGTEGEKGTGLGLVLCKRFVDLNFGEISVTSKERVGTTFKVTLPAATSKHQAMVSHH